ncbi:Tn3 family transposase [Microbispora rosea]|uniref:Tn3 family transposase n=1 Tax=Microbispora rosea TaxID=58117 RepID=UPI00343E93BB
MALCNARIVFDDDGRLRFAALEPEPEPASLLDLRAAVNANATLIDHQASIGLAQEWGGGLVASVDGMRFVVPVPSVYARPNPKYFGRRGGATWLNMINHQAAGLGGKVVAGTPRDSLYVLDVLYDRDGGKRPQMIVTDTASYSDIVFGLLTLAGQLYQRDQDGMADQIGALGLVLNAIVLFHTRYMDAPVVQLRADGLEVRDEDVARLSPFVRHHINVLGRYSSRLPDLPGGLRPLRAPGDAGRMTRIDHQYSSAP